jgi:phosphoglycolate phosphatase-like HAD superfamily hydrolase
VGLNGTLTGLAHACRPRVTFDDSAADMEADHRAGVKNCAVTHGYGKREELAQFTPDYWIDDLRELAGG